MSSSILRKLLIVVLAGVVGVGAMRLLQADVDPEVAFVEEAERVLPERFERYVEYRLNENWPALYELVDPFERTKLDLAGYIGFYGQGVLKTHSIDLQTVHVDARNRLARLRVKTVAELNVAKLPAQYRANLRGATPDELRREREHDLTWVWRDGEWYFRLDDEVLNGHSSPQGTQAVQPLASEG